ncbi:MAG TPA: methyltransferase [Sphingobium sp.]|nr:methyltransferase [Sphingobium sp.]
MQDRLSDHATATDRRDDALLALLGLLRARAYRFITPTPATHRRVIGRPERAEARCLADVLGWSLPFRDGVLDGDVAALLDEAGALQRVGGDRRQSALRVSSVGDTLFLHSAFPTDSEDAVFFGPDSYRFARLIAGELADHPAAPGARLVDMGAGAGVGAIVAGKLCPDAAIVMTDINREALRLARINARAAGVAARLVEGEGLAGVEGPVDLAFANPPYIIDPARRSYRDGGSLHGGAVALAMAREAVARLAEGGRFILYSGSAIVAGDDILGRALAAVAADAGCSLSYEELDPDVFGEELASPAYRDVDRIAVVSAIFRRG